jgi:large subunit ribosomal protein L7/L12
MLTSACKALVCRTSRSYGLALPKSSICSGFVQSYQTTHTINTQKRYYAEETKTKEKEEPADISPAPEHLVKLVDEIAQLNMLEIAQFTKLLQKKLGISGIPMMSAPAAAPAAAAAAAPKEEKKAEKTDYSVQLVKVAEGAKYKIIKELREVKPTLSLMDTKQLVEKLPSILGEKLSKADAEKIAKKIKDAGGEVDII